MVPALRRIKFGLFREGPAAKGQAPHPRAGLTPTHQTPQEPKSGGNPHAYSERPQ